MYSKVVNLIYFSYLFFIMSYYARRRYYSSGRTRNFNNYNGYRNYSYNCWHRATGIRDARILGRYTHHDMTVLEAGDIGGNVQIVTWMRQRPICFVHGGIFYFGKDAKDLSLAESACIIAITNNPSLYGPMYDVTYTRKDGTKITPRELNKERQELILDTMAKEDVINPETGLPYITKAQAEAAKA